MPHATLVTHVQVTLVLHMSVGVYRAVRAGWPPPRTQVIADGGRKICGTGRVCVCVATPGR